MESFQIILMIQLFKHNRQPSPKTSESMKRMYSNLLKILEIMCGSIVLKPKNHLKVQERSRLSHLKRIPNLMKYWSILMKVSVQRKNLQETQKKDCTLKSGEVVLIVLLHHLIASMIQTMIKIEIPVSARLQIKIISLCPSIFKVVK